MTAILETEFSAPPKGVYVCTFAKEITWEIKNFSISRTVYLSDSFSFADGCWRLCFGRSSDTPGSSYGFLLLSTDPSVVSLKVYIIFKMHHSFKEPYLHKREAAYSFGKSSARHRGIFSFAASDMVADHVIQSKDASFYPAKEICSTLKLSVILLAERRISPTLTLKQLPGPLKREVKRMVPTPTSSDNRDARTLILPSGDSSASFTSLTLSKSQYSQFTSHGVLVITVPSALGGSSALFRKTRATLRNKDLNASPTSSDPLASSSLLKSTATAGSPRPAASVTSKSSSPDNKRSASVPVKRGGGGVSKLICPAPSMSYSLNHQGLLRRDPLARISNIISEESEDTEKEADTFVAGR